jgi:hypothetical protein
LNLSRYNKNTELATEPIKMMFCKNGDRNAVDRAMEGNKNKIDLILYDGSADGGLTSVVILKDLVCSGLQSV